MDDMDFVRNGLGTVADLRNWEKGTGGNIKYMGLVMNKEKIIEPETEDNVTQNEELVQERHTQERQIQERQPLGLQESFRVDLNKMRELAEKLMPTVDKIDESDYIQTCENAINLAFAFEQVFAQKIEVM